MENKPISRSKEIRPFSREHHHSLLLCWKIRTGLLNTISLERIKTYSNWYYRHYLFPHFQLEEKHLFPILGQYNQLVKRAISEHKRLDRLFNDEKDVFRSLNLIEEELERHIRFEERFLFNELQKIATPEQLQQIERDHYEPLHPAEWADAFWDEI